MESLICQKIKERLLAADNILILGHARPDGDALGAALALAAFLQSSGKNWTVFFNEPPPEIYGFLSFFEEIKSDSSALTADWDLAVVLDSGELSRASLPMEFMPRLNRLEIINIDHHLTNKNFGNWNLADEKVSSTCELLYDFFKDINWSIERSAAICLLVGILEDTNFFTNAGTNPSSLTAAADLILKGAKIGAISSRLNRQQSWNGLKLWGVMLSRLKINKELNLVFSYVKEEEFMKYGVAKSAADGFASFLNSLGHGGTVAFFRLGENESRVSLRANCDGIDLSALAKIFNGGGHQKAAGFTVPWRVVEKEGNLVVV